MIKKEVHTKLSGSYINSGTFERDIFVSCVILIDYTIYACMLAEQLKQAMLCIHIVYNCGGIMCIVYCLD